MPDHPLGAVQPTPAEARIHRDFGMNDLLDAASSVPLAGTVIVQSQPTDNDTDWLLMQAERLPVPAVVVGWVDLTSADAPGRIAELARNPRMRGLRPMLQSIDDIDWLLGKALSPALSAMCDHGLVFDALVQPRHLSMVLAFMKRWPQLPLVVDHGAKPFVTEGALDPWRADMAALAAAGAYCKLSGLRTEQTYGAAVDALAPYVAHLLECFGDRLMWGSDWPVLLLSGDDYGCWYRDADRLTGLRGAVRERLFHGAAREFYGLEEMR
ncbi:amidohydrolase family protein [Sphingomonas sp. SAFR-052]|uniref:amidohydrolase family protein n=1 Tax=Sphingomonas sp. SAFR-052 TaxID=3436867 RepID=UPI003F7D4CD1